ncbi:MAG: ATP-binding cassette domain-containing protein, partial [Bacteroidales bacterium]|nr:ATP-binding cassette domain-containing protein [Bacteroidales bacterium]
MELFEAINVSKQFANHKALDDVSISVPEKSIFGLLGPNGAGKTTFIRIINQITAPDTGQLYFSGKKLSSSHIKDIGYLPEERGLYKKMKVGEQALYLAQLKGLEKHDAVKKLKFWFEKFDILPWWNRKVEELSKGMQQKIQFIVTILHQPKLLIFDEPFSGFDPINVNLIKEEILELRKKGATIIFSTHNMASVEELCDHIALINNSKKILDGKVFEIKNQYKSNTFEIAFSGYQGNISSLLNNSFELKDQTSENGFTKVKIKIADNASSNDLLKILIPQVKINSINEIIPSMNDIFI